LTVGGLTQVIVDISDEDSNESTISKNKVKSKISRTYFHWTLVEKFEMEDDAYDKLSQKNWKFKQNTVNADGDKSFFRFGENTKCKAGYQFLYNSEDMGICAFTNNIDHDHSWEDDSEWGISKNLKKVK